MTGDITPDPPVAGNLVWTVEELWESSHGIPQPGTSTECLVSPDSEGDTTFGFRGYQLPDGRWAYPLGPTAHIVANHINNPPQET